METITCNEECDMSTPNPIEPGKKTQREREEEKRRRNNPDNRPEKPRDPGVDPSRKGDVETEEEWTRRSR